MGFFAAVALRARGGFGWLQDNRSFSLPAAIGAVALLLRLHGLGDKPFWLDEVTSLRRATSSLPGLVGNSLYGSHYPTYFLLLWLMAKLGTSQWLLRLPSALCGALSASLGCAIGSKVMSDRAGAITGLLIAISPFEVQFGQEARSYTLVCCLILIALWGLVQLAQQPAAAARPFNSKGALRGAWIAYSLGTAAALDVLNVAILWLVAANLGAVAIARAAGQARRGFWRSWAGAHLVILVAWVPLLIAVWVSHGGAVLEGADWAPAGTTRTIWSILAPVYLLRISSFITFDLMPAQFPGWALRLRRRRRLALGGCAATRQCWRYWERPHWCSHSDWVSYRCSCRSWCHGILPGARHPFSSLPVPVLASCPEHAFQPLR